MGKKSKHRKHSSPEPSTSTSVDNHEEEEVDEEITPDPEVEVQSEEEFVDADDGNGESVAEVKKKKTSPKMDKAIAVQSDLMEGMNIIGMMSSDDVDELLNRIHAVCPQMDRLKAKRREEKLSWKGIAFSGWSPEDCRKAWSYLRTKTRGYRIANELVTELKLIFANNRNKFMRELITTAPGFPPKPPTSGGAFHCFNRERWEEEKRNCEVRGVKPPNWVVVRQ